MKASAAVALVALIALAFVTDVHAQSKKVGFCRTSAYTVDCATTKAIKNQMFKICGKNRIRAVGQYIPNRNGCGCSVVQKVDSSDEWDAFQACQEQKGNDPAVNGKLTFKALQDTRCKPGQSKGPC